MMLRNSSNLILAFTASSSEAGRQGFSTFAVDFAFPLLTLAPPLQVTKIRPGTYSWHHTYFASFFGDLGVGTGSKALAKLLTTLEAGRISSMVYTIFSFLAGLVVAVLLPVVVFLEVLFPVPTVSHFSDMLVWSEMLLLSQ